MSGALMTRRGRKHDGHNDRGAAACVWAADDARPHRGATAAADRCAGRGQGLRRRPQPHPRGQQLFRHADARQQDDAAAAGDLRPRSGRRGRQGRRAGLACAGGRACLRQSGPLVRLMPHVPERPALRLSRLDPAGLFRPLAGDHAGLSVWRALSVHHRAGDRPGQTARQRELRGRRAVRLLRHRLCGDEEDRRRPRPDAADQRHQRPARAQRRVAGAGDGRNKNSRHRAQSETARSRQGAGAGADRCSVCSERRARPGPIRWSRGPNRPQTATASTA